MKMRQVELFFITGLQATHRVLVGYLVGHRIGMEEQFLQLVGTKALVTSLQSIISAQRKSGSNTDFFMH